MPPSSAASTPSVPAERATRRRAAPPSRARLAGRASAPGERLLESGLLACALVSVLTTAGMVAVLALESARFFAAVPPGALLVDTRWTPRFSGEHFGIWPLVAGTLSTSALALSVALPLGLLAAVYLSELSAPRLRRWLKPALEVLAGVPGVVNGYFALVIVTPALQALVPGLAGFNALAAGLVLGVSLIPRVSTLAEGALLAVPQSLREAAAALGAGRLATLWRVVLPAARAGIAAAALRAASRAVGETMIVALAAGQRPRLTLDPRLPAETMTAYVVHASRAATPTGTLAYQALFVVGSALFLMTYALSALSQRLERRVRAGG